MRSKWICCCVKLDKEKLKSIVFNHKVSFKKVIQKTGASLYCGSCYDDLKQYFFLFQYQKKIYKEGIFLLDFKL